MSHIFDLPPKSSDLAADVHTSDELRLLREELADTNLGVLALTLELDKRIEEFRNAEAELKRSIADKAALDQLELEKKSAEAANRAKSDFLARMSHEIRTPMNLINGMNSLLLESPLNPTQRKYLEISTRNVRRLLRLINGILDLSKVEAQELAFESKPFDLNEVLKDCAATVEAAVKSKGLDFSSSVHLDTWRYWVGDPERLQQVLLNLIGNAVKFTAQGRIDVLVRPETGPKGEPGLRFTVSDTGCGVPAGKADAIFQAFHQLEEGALNRQYEGTGLGLSISKVLVEKMSGKIWLDAKPEPGTTIAFTVFLEKATEASVQSTSLGSDAGKMLSDSLLSSLPGTNILLVEDNPENVILIEAYLEGSGILLDHGSNGMEAFEKRKRNSYDLILMDVQMPVMDGYASTRLIRAWEIKQHQARVPIIALTAHAFSGAVEESRAAGCDAHLTKPVERFDLISAIGKFAQREPSETPEISEAILARRPLFLANRRTDLEKMRDALANKDFPAIQSIAHNCKGTGTGYGFPEISKLGAAIELAAKALDSEGLVEKLNQFEQSLSGK